MTQTIANGESGLSVRTKLNIKLGECINVKHPDFGAVGNGIADDTAAIQAAIDAAFATGLGDSDYSGSAKGTIVYFPPGVYKVTSSLNDDAAVAVGGARVILMGAGMDSTTITGNFTGFIIDKYDNQVFSFIGIERLNIINADQNDGSGCIRIAFGLLSAIRDCRMGGFIGLDISDTEFDNYVENCAFLPPFSDAPIDSVGIYCSQAVIINVSISGYDIGISTGGIFTNPPGVHTTTGAASVVLLGGRIEGCNTAIYVGRSPNNDGASQTNGLDISGFSFERCGTGIYVGSMAGGSFRAINMTGTIGPGKTLSSASWSGGTATYISLNDLVDGDPTWTSGTRVISIESMNVSGYNVTEQTATRTGAKTFTIAIANPGGSATGGTWSRMQQYGMRVFAAQGLHIAGVNPHMDTEQARMDFSGYSGSNTVVSAVYAAAVSAGSRWVMPTNTSKRRDLTIIGCDLDVSNAFPFADLPASPVEGMEFDITDGRKTGAVPLTGSDLGATVIAGGSQHVKVRYNGTNWTCVGF